jgi:N-acetylglucosaminyl-diphospho-decaprenol L-rhamnosyltransferase
MNSLVDIPKIEKEIMLDGGKSETKAVKNIDLSVVIVSYNTNDLTCESLRSIYDNDMNMEFEVIVYDNNSEDGSVNSIATEFPMVRIIESDKNVGFAAANNIAAGMASGNWLLLLNPDTRVFENGVGNLFKFAVGTGKSAIFGGASHSPDGKIDYRSCWAKPSLWGLTSRALGLSAVGKKWSFLNPEEMPEWPRNSTREVDVITGCFLMLKKSTWLTLGGFDVDYFMYSEETDLCLRASQLNIDRIYYPGAKIIHVGGASEKSKPHKTIKLFRGKCIYFSKHRTRLAAAYASLILDMHVLLRASSYQLLGLFRAKYWEEADHWRAVWGDRENWNVFGSTFSRTVTYSTEQIEDRHIRCAIQDSIEAA